MHHSLHVLHADDDAEDRWLFREGLVAVDSRVCLTQFEDGKDLLHFLHGLSPGAPAVHLIICDMQMSQVGGIGLLEAIKQLDGWKETPVVIFSTSSFERDIRQCLAKGATAFYSKPGTYSENLSVIRQLLTHCCLPMPTSLV
jgi:CheY-like chemotaxis protein